MNTAFKLTAGITLLAAGSLFAEELKLGKPLDVENFTRIEELLSRPEEFVGKRVKIQGKITEVCNMMQCWVKIQESESGKIIQVKVNDGEIFFPKDGIGKQIVAQGEMVRITMTREQHIALLKHEAEEQGTTIDTSNINEGKTIYRIKGTGAVIEGVLSREPK